METLHPEALAEAVALDKAFFESPFHLNRSYVRNAVVGEFCTPELCFCNDKISPLQTEVVQVAPGARTRSVAMWNVESNGEKA